MVPEVFFSLAAGCFGGGRQNFGLCPRPWAKLKTANEKSQAPRNTERDFLEIIVLYYEHGSSPQTKQTSLVSGPQNSVEILVLGPDMCTTIGVRTIIIACLKGNSKSTSGNSLIESFWGAERVPRC